MAMKYRHVFVGGTFDGLHKGHMGVLLRAFQEGERVTVGLTSDVFVKKFKIRNLKFSLKIRNSKLKIRGYETRKQAINRWIINHTYKKRARIVPIHDPYEPAVSGDFDAIIVTKDNRTTGEEINRKRKAKGLNELALIEIPLIFAHDHAPISSTRVRNGEIDPKGRLIMPQSLIPMLRNPLGKIVREKETKDLMKDLKEKIVITVGDQTTKTLLDQGIIPHLAIIDQMVGRKKYIKLHQFIKQSHFVIGITSGPGFIAKDAILAIQVTLARQAGQGRQASQARQGRQATQEKHVIVVDGEEDLLALPAILNAPIGSVVLYGQPASLVVIQGSPKEGIVIVDVDSKVKKIVQKLMKKFLGSVHY